MIEQNKQQPAAAQEAVAEITGINGRNGVEIHWLEGPAKIGDLLYAAPVTAAPADAEEDAYVIGQMGKLLAEIAVIVNGPEPAGTRWSYHDLPEKVKALASTPAAPGIDNTTPVDRGALQMAINVLRRAGKDEVADALIDASPKGGSEARDAALNTLAQMFHNSEEMEGPDGMVVSIDLSLWHEALEAYEVLIDGYDEVTLATSAQAQASDAEVRP